MTNTYVWSDLHLDHVNIPKFRYVDSVEENTEWILEAWRSTVGPNDTILLLGDIAMSKASLDVVEALPGYKVLVMGNHDIERDGMELTDLIGVYDRVTGLLNRRGCWFSHSPMHPDELYGKINVHGHQHNNSVKDPRYVNVNVDLAPRPVLLADILNGLYTTHDYIKPSREAWRLERGL